MRDLATWIAVMIGAWWLVWLTLQIVAARRVGYLLALSCLFYRWAHGWVRFAEGFDSFACRWYALTGQQPAPECQWARRPE
jgi:hypothetical protein